MSSKNIWFFLLFLALALIFSIGIWSLGLWVGGCGTSQQEIISPTTTFSGGPTTTVTGETTTTTVPPSAGISGTVSWSWSGPTQNGTLFVFLWTDEDFSDRDLMATNSLLPAYKKIVLSSGQTSASYNFNSPGGPLSSPASPVSNYYVLSLLYIGRSAELFDDPAPGDLIGQFSDGKLPAAFGGTTHAAGFAYTGTPVSDRNFSLNGTWPEDVTTTTTSTSIPPTTTTIPPFTGKMYVRSLSFINQDQGWVMGEKLDTYPYSQIVYKTTDGGTTWASYETGVTISNLLYYDMQFVDSNTGWIVDDKELIMKTTDGGETWTTQHINNDFVSGILGGVSFVNANVGWAAGMLLDPVYGQSPGILHTIDGGTTWTSQDAGIGSQQGLFDVNFVNENVGWAVGICISTPSQDRNKILKTVNGGASWQYQTASDISSPFYPIDPPFNSVFFVDQNNGWICGDSVILHTTDGGITWVQQPSGGTNMLNDIFFIDPNTGWVVGYGGMIMKTTNGGTTWIQQSSGIPWQLWEVQFLSASVGWAAGAELLKTTDGGSTWNIVPLP